MSSIFIFMLLLSSLSNIPLLSPSHLPLTVFVSTAFLCDLNLCVAALHAVALFCFPDYLLHRRHERFQSFFLCLSHCCFPSPRCSIIESRFIVTSGCGQLCVPPSLRISISPCVRMACNVFTLERYVLVCKYFHGFCMLYNALGSLPIHCLSLQ